MEGENTFSGVEFLEKVPSLITSKKGIRNRKRLCAEKRKGKGRRCIRNKLIPRPHSPFSQHNYLSATHPHPHRRKGRKGKENTHLSPSNPDPSIRHWPATAHMGLANIFRGKVLFFADLYFCFRRLVPEVDKANFGVRGRAKNCPFFSFPPFSAELKAVIIGIFFLRYTTYL